MLGNDKRGDIIADLNTVALGAFKSVPRSEKIFLSSYASKYVALPRLILQTVVVKQHWFNADQKQAF